MAGIIEHTYRPQAVTWGGPDRPGAKEPSGACRIGEAARPTIHVTSEGLNPTVGTAQQLRL
jgi:hypothetical protein